MAIWGEKIYLRPMELEDMAVYQEMINDEVIANNVVGWSFPVSQYQQQSWFQSVVSDPKNKRFSVVLINTDDVVGMVTLSSIDWHNRSATHGIKLRSTCPRNAGIGKDAVLTLMKYAFEDVGLNRLDGSWIEYNIASKKLYIKCGWHEEGKKKEAIFRNGAFHDLIIAGITRNEYIEFIKNNK